MTGRELIIYILENHLEDKPIFNAHGTPIGHMTVSEAAVKFNVGVATIWAWISNGQLEFVGIPNTDGITVFIPATAKSPLELLKDEGSN